MEGGTILFFQAYQNVWLIIRWRLQQYHQYLQDIDVDGGFLEAVTDLVSLKEQLNQEKLTLLHFHTPLFH